MLLANRFLRDTALSGVPSGVATEAWVRSPSGRRALMASRSLNVSSAREPAPAATRDIVQAVAAIAVAVTVCLSIIDVCRLRYEVGQTGGVRAGLLAALVTIPLHVRHLLYGVRGERPPAGAWTLAIMAIVTIAGTYFVGSLWPLEFAPLVVSIVLIVPGRAATILAAIVVVLPLFLVNAHWYAENGLVGGPYLSLAVVWRSVTQFVPLQLLASLRALDAANRRIEAQAVVQTRVRIDNELRGSVGSALQQIVARGEAARITSTVNATQASIELRRLVSDTRRALTDARHIVSSYRAASLRAELDAATSLLEASGATVHVLIDDDVHLDAPDENARASIRASLGRALREEPRSSYVVRVGRDRLGQFDIAISSEEHVPDASRAP
jgi:two-component system, NarL family, sensor histidine kinase DesK